MTAVGTLPRQNYRESLPQSAERHPRFRYEIPEMVVSALSPLVAYSGRSLRPVGAQLHDGGVSFRVWAPGHTLVRVATGDGTTTRYVVLEPEAGEPAGFFVGRDEQGRAGDIYWLEVDHELIP